MKSVHLIIPDLFLPKDIAADVCAGLNLSTLEKLLGHGHTEILEPAPLENLLCELFGVMPETQGADAPVAPISADFDGLAAGCWLRADPVHLGLQRDQLLLLPNGEISADEAEALCASLNEHFAGQGMEFAAPHPQRWYVRTDAQPCISTRPLSQVIGGDVRGALPTGDEAARWHQLFNEIQMLLFAHPLNAARVARGALPVNSLWLWGGGCSVNASPQKNYENLLSGHPYDSANSDEILVEMFAAAAGIPFAAWPQTWREAENNGRQLLVWAGLRSALQSGDLAAWRTALQEFESDYAQPLWQALRSGKIARLQLDIMGKDSIRRVVLTRGYTWAFWRRARRLADYSFV